MGHVGPATARPGEVFGLMMTLTPPVARSREGQAGKRGEEPEKEPLAEEGDGQVSAGAPPLVEPEDTALCSE